MGHLYGIMMGTLFSFSDSSSPRARNLDWLLGWQLRSFINSTSILLDGADFLLHLEGFVRFT
jgi:hypothetical protein